MTSSTEGSDLLSLIDEVCALTSTDTLRCLIDEAILLAAGSFGEGPKAPITTETFLEVIGEFVGQLYAHGLGVARQLTSSQARAEAVAILEEGYEGPDSRGFDAALMDGTDPKGPGIEWVLERIAAAIIVRQRSQHVRWVFETRINSLNWADKCRLAEFLIAQNTVFFPEALLGCRPAQLAHLLAELITILSAAEEKLALIRSGHITR
jgi:hypothetical protein